MTNKKKSWTSGVHMCNYNLYRKTKYTFFHNISHLFFILYYIINNKTMNNCNNIWSLNWFTNKLSSFNSSSTMVVVKHSTLKLINLHSPFLTFILTISLQWNIMEVNIAEYPLLHLKQYCHGSKHRWIPPFTLKTVLSVEGVALRSSSLPCLSFGKVFL